MELQHIRTFIEVVKYKNFSRAGKSLGLSQPAVSRQIEALEKMLGVELLIRSPRSVTITQEGHRFYQKSKEFSSWVQDEFLEKTRSSIKIGSIEGWLHTQIIEHNINELSHVFENISLEILPSKELLEKVVCGELDCAFTSYNIQTESMSSLKVFLEEYVLISKKQIKSLDEIKHYRLIVHGETDLMYKKMQKNTSPHIQVNSIWALIKLVEMGIGVAVVPKYLVANKKNLNTLKYPTKDKKHIYMNMLNYQKIPDKLEKVRRIFSRE